MNRQLLLYVFLLLVICALVADVVGNAEERKPHGGITVGGQTVAFGFTLITDEKNELTANSKRLLQSGGYGINGQKNGSRAMMYFEDGRMGPGWIDSNGEPQSVIYPFSEPSLSSPNSEDALASGPRGSAGVMGQTLTVLYTPDTTLHERVPGQPTWKAIPGNFEKTTRSVQHAGTELSVTYYAFTNSQVSDYSARLLKDIGCDIKGRKEGSRVRINLSNGAVGVGSVDAGGNLKIVSTEGWREPELE